tara:strand:- start:33 stop:437 length:405 start_codon:yes stop_codon:yes gene_type:complete
MAKKIKVPNARMLKQTLALVSRKAGKRVMSHFEKNFDKQGSETEKGTFVRWAERSSANKSRKPILKDTGRLRKSFKIKFNKGGFSIINPIPYGAIHQQGNDNLPERPIIWHSEEIDNIIVAELDKKVMKMLGIR